MDFTRRDWHELAAARGWDSGHATCRGESRSSRRTQPWICQKKWWSEWRLAAGSGRRWRRRRRQSERDCTRSDTMLKIEDYIA